MSFQKSDFLEYIKRSSDQILKSAGSDNLAGLTREVSACPGWDIAQVCSHQGFVFRYASEHLVKKAKDPLLTDEIPKAPGDGKELLEWFEESAGIVLSALEGTDMEEEIWNWTSEPTAKFWFRRMAHETAIHAWDATQAAGQDYVTDDSWGADGVDEYLRGLLPGHMANRKDLPKPSGTLHLHRTDEGKGIKEWFCQIENSGEADGGADGEGGELKVSLEHSKGDVAVQAGGGNLHLWVWGRASGNDDGNDDEDGNENNKGVKYFGDEKVAEEWMAFCP